MKKHLSFMVMTLVVLPAIAVISSAAQTQTSTTGTTIAAAGPTTVADPVPAGGGPVSLAAQGAGSTNQGYVFIRGYAFHIHRSNGDPAVINSDGTNTSSVTNFNYGTEGAFKIEAGWNATNNFGFRGSYFYTNQKAAVNRTGAATAPFSYSTRPLNVLETGRAAPNT